MSKKQNIQTFWTLSLLILFILLNALTISSCGTSNLSSEWIDDPTSIPANFAVGKIVDETSGHTSVVASAIFKGEGLTTVSFLDGTVELEDPQGNIIPLEIKTNRFGAPYYTAEIPAPLKLNSIYSFRVTLPSGRMIVNSIKTPGMDLEILSPETGTLVQKAAPLELRWSGWNTREAYILLSPETHRVLDVFESGGKLAEDDGLTVLLPESMRNVEQGRNVLSVARINRARANGFHPNSTVGAVILDSLSVTVE